MKKLVKKLHTIEDFLPREMPSLIKLDFKIHTVFKNVVDFSFF